MSEEETKTRKGSHLCEVTDAFPPDSHLLTPWSSLSLRMDIPPAPPSPPLPAGSSGSQVGLHLGPPSASPAWAGSFRFPQRAPARPGAPTPDAPFCTRPGPRDPPQLSLPGLGPSSPALLSVSGRSLSAESAGPELSGHFGCPQSHSEVPHSWPRGGARRGGCEATGETEAGARRGGQRAPERH